jgi:hypothetical protein
MNTMNTTSRRALLAGAPVAAAAALAGGSITTSLAAGLATPSGIDPIFAVIAEHQAAYVGVIAAYAREDREYDDDEITDAAHERAGDAGYDLFTTAPTTVAGVAALLGYLGTKDIAYNPKQKILEWSHGGNGEAVREFPTFLAAALRNIIARGQA